MSTEAGPTAEWTEGVDLDQVTTPYDNDVPSSTVLAAYPEEFLQCRVDRHRWGTAIWVLVTANISERVQQCERCGMKRGQQVNTKTWGRIGYTRYSDPKPGYYTRHSGLVMDDFRRKLFADGFEKAAKEKTLEDRATGKRHRHEWTIASQSARRTVWTCSSCHVSRSTRQPRRPT